MKGTFQIIEIGEPIETEPLLKVVDGKIFVEGVETIDNELIGMAFKDFAERMQGKVLCNSPVLIKGENWNSDDIISK